ncbi:allophanate hydrolase subunit 1 [Nocardioides sp. InS609-2]|uniref:5-oxoprolinase subunit B family protein n=1 Tax=Nocardioides sp. InS609-2 TaxID=2760705 RepID=UPI0017A2A3EF|nr:allophanate hydrolase subunit 1 [Nocardioides sp. InS609-2]MBA3780915.1 allophanate hydrolase subunit 1 [Nocardioides sp.]
MAAYLDLRSVGAHAVRAKVGETRSALALASWARSARVPAVEIVPAATTVLFDGVADVAAVRDLLAMWPGDVDAATEGDLVEIPTVYDGPDLPEVAELWSMSVDDVVTRHGATEFVAAFCGFAPGFSYLAGLPDELAVPRRATPRTRCGAGAVALADTWCGIYPNDSPGGWQLIGRTDAALWDAGRDAPALLPPGTRVRFVPA